MKRIAGKMKIASVAAETSNRGSVLIVAMKPVGDSDILGIGVEVKETDEQNFKVGDEYDLDCNLADLEDKVVTAHASEASGQSVAASGAAQPANE